MGLLLGSISILGSIASIVGAWWAWKQAGISQTAADLANRIKEQLINQRKTSELSELQAYLESARKTFLKYGSSKPSSLAGINYDSDSEVVFEFIHRLKSFREYFSSPNGNNLADNIYKAIEDELCKFKSAKTQKMISNIGTSILNKIVHFSPILKNALTEQKETSV